MEGARFIRAEARRPDLRFPFPKDFVKRLTGKTVTGLGRRAKYLLADLSSGEVLLMHLGMSGSFRVEKSGQQATPGEFYHPRGESGKHDHVVFEMSSGLTVIFNDPRRFGFMKLIAREGLENEPHLKALGPSRSAIASTRKRSRNPCAAKKTSLKAALSDQRVVAGLGNIYVCEALHRAHLSPKRRASTLSDKKGHPTDGARDLADAIRFVLNEAIKAGGSSLRDHRQTTGELGYFQHHFRVYDREGEPCPTPRCKGKVRRIAQVGRSTFYCPVCQR